MSAENSSSAHKRQPESVADAEMPIEGKGSGGSEAVESHQISCISKFQGPVQVFKYPQANFAFCFSIKNSPYHQCIPSRTGIFTSWGMGASSATIPLSQRGK